MQCKRSHKGIYPVPFFPVAIFVIAIVASYSIVLAATIRSNSLQAVSDGISVTVQWISDDESNVDHYDIQRRSGAESQFNSITLVSPKGPSIYQFTDNTAFRKATTLYQYQVIVYYKNGIQPVTNGPVTVTHTVSGVRRTWGSIKAMFR